MFVLMHAVFTGGRSSRNRVGHYTLGSGGVVPSYNYSNLNLTEEDHVQRLAKFSKVCLSVSLFFWCWAMLNTYKMNGTNFDLGVISFFLSGSSSFYLYLKTKEGLTKFRSPGNVGRGIILVSHLTVALNYALGAFLAFTLGDKIYYRFAIYCILFFFGWTYTAFIGWQLVTNTLHIGKFEDDADNIDNSSDFDF